VIAAAGLLAYAALLLAAGAPALARSAWPDRAPAAGAFSMGYCPVAAAALPPGPTTAHCGDMEC